ncbi:MAG TPA: polysaccharide deacetylase family protein [Bacteroidales bacterium]|nr:polysaccharide deacetylase family protein [Bacteroidales bacterium]
MFYLIRNPFVFRQIYRKSLRWKVYASQNEVFLTFDDGPTPELTQSILAILKDYDAKATFFCVGENVKKHPELFRQILDEGHTVGNHSFNHLNAWESEEDYFLENVEKAAELIPSKLFRPPYGKITPNLIEKLKQKYKIVMWTVLSGDFDADVNAKKCFENATRKTKSGDIIVFHDNVKAKENVLEALPKTLAYFAEKGIMVNALPKKSFYLKSKDYT